MESVGGVGPWIWSIMSVKPSGVTAASSSSCARADSSRLLRPVLERYYSLLLTERNSVDMNYDNFIF